MIGTEIRFLLYIARKDMKNRYELKYGVYRMLTN